jgi:hypothetical protein
MGVKSISYVAWSWVAAAYVENCGRDPARCRTQAARLNQPATLSTAHVDTPIYPNGRANEFMSMEGIV